MTIEQAIEKIKKLKIKQIIAIIILIYLIRNFFFWLKFGFTNQTACIWMIATIIVIFLDIKFMFKQKTSGGGKP